MNSSEASIRKKLQSFLDNMVRIRAVQDFTPSQAVFFYLPSGRIIREELRVEIAENSYQMIHLLNPLRQPRTFSI